MAQADPSYPTGNWHSDRRVIRLTLVTKYDGKQVTYEGERFYPSPEHSRCTAACWWCSQNWWKWLKGRESQMTVPMTQKVERSRSLEYGPSANFVLRAGGPAFAPEAERSCKP